MVRSGGHSDRAGADEKSGHGQRGGWSWLQTLNPIL